MTRSLQPSTASTVPMGDSYASTQSQYGDDGGRRNAIKQGGQPFRSGANSTGVFGALSGLSKAAESLFHSKTSAPSFQKPSLSATKLGQSYQKPVGSTGYQVQSSTGANPGPVGYATPLRTPVGFGNVVPSATGPTAVSSNEDNVAAAVAAMSAKKRKVAPSAKRARPAITTVDHAYNDYSSMPDDQALKSSEERKNTGGVITPFQEKLHEMLTTNVDTDVIDWSPHGRCFIVRKPKEFTQTVLPKYFKHKKLTSFQRQLNLYGFKRITKGRDQGAYYHELFLRDRPKLCKRMRRQKVKGTGHKPLPDPDNEPDFYQMEFLPDSRAKSSQTSEEEAKPPAQPSNDINMDSQEFEDGVVTAGGKETEGMNGGEEQLEELADVPMQDESLSLDGGRAAFSDDSSDNAAGEDNAPLQPLVMDNVAVPDDAPSSLAREANRTDPTSRKDKLQKRQSAQSDSLGQMGVSLGGVGSAFPTISTNESGLNDLSNEIQNKRDEIRRLMQEEQRLILLHQQKQHQGVQGFTVPSSSHPGSTSVVGQPVHLRGQSSTNVHGFQSNYQAQARTSNHPNFNNIEPVPFSQISTPEVVSSSQMDIEGQQSGITLPGGVVHNSQIHSQDTLMQPSAPSQQWWPGNAPYQPQQLHTAMSGHHLRNNPGSPKRHSLSMSSESGSQSLFGRGLQRMSKAIPGWPSTSKKSDFSSNGSDDWVNDDDLTRNSLDGNIDFDEIFESSNFRPS